MRAALNSYLPTIGLSERLKFSHVFQPIFCLQKDTVVGYESLIRNEEMKNPQLLFALAEQQNQLFDLDISSVLRSITCFDQSTSLEPTKPYLSVNIFPSTISNTFFLLLLDDVMSRVNLSPNNIIFELNEAEPVGNIKSLQKSVRHLQNYGFLIALDDLGKGQSSLRIGLELEPDMVKLDQYFSVDLEKSSKKQRFLEWITSYFRAENTLVTLEGIETDLQLNIAKQAGINYGQGFFLGKPQPLKNYF